MSLRTEDLAVSPDSEHRLAVLEGSAISVGLRPGASVKITTDESVTNSGFTRDNGPTLIFD